MSKFALLAFSSFAALFCSSFALSKQLWPQTVGNSLLFEILSMQAMHLLVFLIINGLYFYIYSLDSAFFEQFKVERLPWPWQASPQKWLQLRRDTLINFGLNFLLGVILAYLAGSLNSVSFRNDRDSLPSLPETLAHLAFCMVLEDLLFYTSHRLLHTPSLYRFHKQHHEYRVTGKARKNYSVAFGGILPSVGVRLGKPGPVHRRAEATGASDASTQRADAYRGEGVQESVCAQRLLVPLGGLRVSAWSDQLGVPLVPSQPQ